MAITSIPGLPWNVPIIDPKTGCATSEFAIWWQQNFGNAQTLDTGVTANTAAIALKVSTTGSPASGNLAKFSGASSITNGDLSGDVSTTGTLVTTIGNAKVSLAKIANASASSKVLGSGASGVGASYVELTLGSGLTMSGTTLSSTSAGGPPLPIIRNSNIQSSSAASYTVSWPTGTVVGDFVIIFAGHGFAINLPSGWLSINSSTGSNWNGACFWKYMTAADITAGSVTVTTGGAFNGVVAAITLIGNRYTFMSGSTVVSRNGTGAASRTLSTDGTPNTTDMMLYFGSNRNASNDTVNQGSVQQAINATAASGCLYAGRPSSNGDISAIFSYSVSSGTTGDYQVVLDVRAV